MRIHIYIYVLIAFIFIQIFLFYLPSVYAHDKAQPSFFKVNGAYLDHYPITTTSLNDFILPQEIDSVPILVNQSSTFEIEKARIPLPNISSQDELFLIDFGDGKSEHGVSQNHTYSQIGSYIITLSVKPLFSDKEIIFDKALINVVPDKDFKLPQAVISINGSTPGSSTSQINFSEKLNFSGEESTSSSQIINYLWDLGDGQTSDLPELTHSYASYEYGANLLLRVKDGKGFISDKFLRLEDKSKQDAAIVTDKKIDPSLIKKIVGIVILALPLGVLAYLNRGRFKITH